MRWTEAAKVGTMIVIAAAALLGTLWVINRGRTFRETKTVLVVFEDAQGVTPGAEVKLRGVKVGEVTKIELDEQQRPVLTLRVPAKLPLSRKDGFRISTPALSFSPPNIEILPDYYADRPTAQLATGPYQGINEAGAEEVFSKSRDLLDNLDQLTRRVTEVVGTLADLTEDPEVKQGMVTIAKNFTTVSESGVRIARGMESTVSHVNQLAAKFDSTADHLDQTLVAANDLVKQFQDAATNVTDTTEDAKRLVSDSRDLVKDTRDLVKHTDSAVQTTQNTVSDTRERVTRLFDSLDESVKTLNETLTAAQDVIGDPKTKEDLKSTLANLKGASENLAGVSKDVRGVTSDPAVQDDLKAAIAGLRDASEAAGEAFRRVNDLLGKGKPKLDRIHGNLKQTSFQSETVFSSRNDRTRLDANFILPWDRRTFFTAGFYDLGESSRINLQAGRQLVPGANVRYGFYAGRLGVGLDFGPRNRPNLFVNLFGLRDQQLDIRARLPLWSGFNFTAGFDDLTDKDSLVIGLDYRR